MKQKIQTERERLIEQANQEWEAEKLWLECLTGEEIIDYEKRGDV